MEYLVTMTTHVPDGTPERAVDDVRAHEAAHSRGGSAAAVEAPAAAARDSAQMETIVKALPLGPWMTTELTPLTPHPSDPATMAS